MHSFLRSFFPVADAMAGAYGRRCEVVVYDLTRQYFPAVYCTRAGSAVKNGEEFLPKELCEFNSFEHDHGVNLFRTARRGVTVRVSASLLRNDVDEVIGMLCVYIDTSLEQMLLAEAEQFCLPRAEVSLVSEKSSDILSLTQERIHQIIGYADAKELSRAESIELVRWMDHEGIFLVKGAVEMVAAQLGISKVTVYSYLDRVKGKR